MHAHIEPIAAVVRVFADGDDYGDPYTFAATLRWVDRGTVELMGVLRAPTPLECHAVVAAIGRMGVRRVIWCHRGRMNSWSMNGED